MSRNHPAEDFLRMERIPHIWCAGCGIGTSLNCFIRAVQESGIAGKDLCVVSGIGCSGRVAGYVKTDSFHTTHGRAIPFAAGLKLANPRLNVVVYSGDGDLIAIGGNHFIHAARCNYDITVLCINNFNYGMTGGQAGPTTPHGAVAVTTPWGNFVDPFNLPHLADSSGAVYVARWTTYQVRQLVRSIGEAIRKKGFSFVEIISSCPTLYERRNRLGTAVDRMRFFKKNTVVRNGEDTKMVPIRFQEKIVVGRFVDRERPTFLDAREKILRSSLGSKYRKYEGAV